MPSINEVASFAFLLFVLESSRRLRVGSAQAFGEAFQALPREHCCYEATRKLFGTDSEPHTFEGGVEEIHGHLGSEGLLQELE